MAMWYCFEKERDELERYKEARALKEIPKACAQPSGKEIPGIIIPSRLYGVFNPDFDYLRDLKNKR